MISIQGKGVSTGVAMGPLCYYRRAKSTIRRYQVADVHEEWGRFKAARSKAIDELSVSPRSVLPLRQKIRETTVADVKDKLLSDLLGDENAI